MKVPRVDTHLDFWLFRQNKHLKVDTFGCQDKHLLLFSNTLWDEKMHPTNNGLNFCSLVFMSIFDLHMKKHECKFWTFRKTKQTKYYRKAVPQDRGRKACVSIKPKRDKVQKLKNLRGATRRLKLTDMFPAWFLFVFTLSEVWPELF